VLIGDTWIDEKDIPEDNLVEVENWETDNSLKVDGVYTNWVLTEIKERLKLYVRATFTVGEDLLTSNPLPEYGLIFKFNNREEPYSKTVNDMIGNPFKAGTHE
jgi:hypothetical protein